MEEEKPNYEYKLTIDLFTWEYLSDRDLLTLFSQTLTTLEETLQEMNVKAIPLGHMSKGKPFENR